MDFTFHETQMVQWSWLEMVAQLDDTSMQQVVGDGLVRCEFSPRPNSYDHKTHHAMKQLGIDYNGPQLRIMDFVLWRTDRTGIRLHPQWSKTWIETYDVEGHPVQVSCPSKGPGTSDGPGTYRFFKNVGTKEQMRYDHAKSPPQLRRNQ